MEREFGSVDLSTCGGEAREWWWIDFPGFWRWLEMAKAMDMTSSRCTSVGVVRGDVS